MANPEHTQKLHATFSGLQENLAVLQNRPANRGAVAAAAAPDQQAAAAMKPPLPPGRPPLPPTMAPRPDGAKENAEQACLSNYHHGALARERAGSPSIGETLPAGEPLFTFAAMVGNTKLGQLAVDNFQEKDFMAMAQKGLFAELQRTKDGATGQSRIAELAGALPRGWSSHGSNAVTLRWHALAGVNKCGCLLGNTYPSRRAIARKLAFSLCHALYNATISVRK